MFIAVASNNGKKVNLHFGQTTQFYIYEMTGSKQAMVEVRTVQPFSTGDKTHPFDPGKFAAILDVIKDCERVYCTQIGDRPREELDKEGISAVVFDGTISSIVT